MNITTEHIEQAAEFAKLALTQEENKMFAEYITKVLDLADSNKDVDITGVVPTIYPIPMQNVFRDDMVENSYSREDMLKNAPSHENGYIKVPKVME